jgi:hypothetical protein
MMDLINAAGVAAPVLPYEDVPCPPLHGAVRVRALMLTSRLAIEQKVARLRAKNPDDPDGAAYGVIPEVLSIAVVDAKDQPIYSRTRWEIFGAQHTALTLELFNTAWRLSGMSGDDAKKN